MNAPRPLQSPIAQMPGTRRVSHGRLIVLVVVTYIAAMRAPCRTYIVIV
ncbi:MAG: hypothetical protein H0T80_10710 [Betaproteobacteria bacterium]|nr:hypothetical protein [Betaproteobacteria bacterium]